MKKLYLILLVGLFAVGCDQLDPREETDTIPVQSEVDLLFTDGPNKTLSPEVISKRNAYCIQNPGFSKCAGWCVKPEADCGDGGGDDGGDDGDDDDGGDDGDDDNPNPGPDEIPTDRTDLGGNGWNNDIPNPSPGVIIFTGYSNSAQSAQVFIEQFASTYNNYTFINCATGGRALERWVDENVIDQCSAASAVRDQVVLTVNMIATQFAVTAAESAATIAEKVPQLDAQLKSRFPNAIHAYYGGEPAHWVEPSNCPRICEPVRKLASDWAGAAALAVGSYLGPYIWAGLGIPNAHGFVYTINDFLNPSGDYANQHPSDSGRLKVAQQYDIWFRENGIN